MISLTIINKNEFLQASMKIVERQTPYAATPQIRTIVQREFNSLKSQMIAEFLNLPITQEIMAGPRARNISGTLKGYGNLFSFIGFDASYDPIQPIIELLQQTRIEFVKTTPKYVNFKIINKPNAQEIFAVTPLPWATGRSWAQGMEQGLSGLGWYLYKPKGVPSRSGTAVQSKFGRRSKKRPGLVGFRRLNSDRSVNTKLANVKYISDFVNRWNKRFNKLQ